MDGGNPQGTEPLLREGLEISRKGLPPGHWQTAVAESVLGRCLISLKRYDEAEPLLVESYPIIKSNFGDRDRLTQRALSRIIDLYEAWGKPDKAAEYRAMLPKPGDGKP
jgi:hypothetical protein